MGGPRIARPPLAARLSALMCQLENAAEAEPVQRAPIIREVQLYGILAKQGKIEFSVSGRMWRTVKILVGPCAGMRTAENPDGHRVWMVGDKAGVRRISGGQGGPVVKPEKDELLAKLQAEGEAGK